ncbi:MAG: hypothetical protein KIT72_06275 [Polyangiaceae bacterium]|nr:hypothetical protein [Polyangiaceae bacterium]MCW5790007.1 hypothetical protein [Polyangiaceae bacterium]
MTQVYWYGTERTPVTVKEALRRLEALEELTAADVTIEVDPVGILTILLSSERGFVMWMTEAGDVGKVASVPSGVRAHWYFMLSNGQRDVYEDGQTVPREDALRIARWFIEAPERLPEVNWE